MKTNPLFLILSILLLFLAGACKEDDDVEKMTLSTHSFDVAPIETDITLEVNSQNSWEASSDAAWCVPDKLKGTGKATLSIHLTANKTSQERNAILTITDPTTTFKVNITQDAENHYKLPVIFHVLYNNANDANQNPNAYLLTQIISICNQKYANTFDDGDKGKQGVNLNLEFVMATTDPNGKTLAEPGIDRIRWNTPVMSCDDFMNANYKEAIPLLWDLNKYINIFLYTFEEDDVLGISYVPYASSGHPLDGLYNGDRYFSDSQLDYPHCISINNTYIQQLPKFGSADLTDITVTLAHETAHYIGLFHAFGVDDEEKKISWREDTDYCEDTPNYDRKGYEKWENDYFATTPSENMKFSDVVKRTSITGNEFTARNIMDYYWTWGNEFTPDQRKRMRHVLYYSPLMPGPKYDQPSPRAIMDALIPPARTIK